MKDMVIMYNIIYLLEFFFENITPTKGFDIWQGLRSSFFLSAKVTKKILME